MIRLELALVTSMLALVSIPVCFAQSMDSNQQIIVNDEKMASPKTKVEDPSLSNSDVLLLTKNYFSRDLHPVEALQQLNSLKSVNYNDPQYEFSIAKLRIQLDQYSHANTELKGLLVDEPNNSDYLLAKAYCLFKLKQIELAQDCLRLARFHNPTLPKEIRFAD